VRIGQSTDIHAFIEGRPLILGGVTIEHPLGLLGHSDADVLLHAICEAIIGALGLGDIGKHFPDTDPAYKGISSMILLNNTWQLMDNEGYRLVNVDSLILIEKPKIAPYIEEMKKNISLVLRCDINQVNVKATRGEKIGFVGRQEGVMAQAVVLLERKDK
jgi:2-C-methyl-D-erythritol 2,4-cyclodiphosphate synthase